jgi:poly-gamma-glutamate capsule biosynthesis protein CapA/YwtB (metallophosphatase superfamily)
VAVKVALAGDTMLGRGVSDRLRHHHPEAIVGRSVIDALAEADLFLLNLECAISERGQPWPDPFKPFFFRAPPAAVDLLTYLRVDAVTLANNHALDYGYEALMDTLDHLTAAGIAVTGAGATQQAARAPALLRAGETTVAVIGLTDHPADYAADPTTPGVAYADLSRHVPQWVRTAVADSDADVLVAFPHWGPNMVSSEVAHVRRAAAQLLRAGATFVAGHSAHVFHGVSPEGVLYDLGDFIDDFATDETLRNDLGMLWFVTVQQGAVTEVEALPLKLGYCRTDVATGDDAAWISHRFHAACREFHTTVTQRGDHLVVDLAAAPAGRPPHPT